jgi:hypothetical protein
MTARQLLRLAETADDAARFVDDTDPAQAATFRRAPAEARRLAAQLG